MVQADTPQKAPPAGVETPEATPAKPSDDSCSPLKRGRNRQSDDSLDQKKMERMEEKGSRSPDKKKRRAVEAQERPKVMNLQLMSSFSANVKEEDEGTVTSSVSYHAAGGDMPVFTQGNNNAGK